MSLSPGAVWNVHVPGGEIPHGVVKPARRPRELVKHPISKLPCVCLAQPVADAFCETPGACHGRDWVRRCKIAGFTLPFHLPDSFLPEHLPQEQAAQADKTPF